MHIVFLFLGLCAALSAPIAQPSLPEPDLFNVDASDPPFELTASDDHFLFEENQEGPLLLTSNPSVYPESTNEAQADGESQSALIEATSSYEATDLENLGISTDAEVSYHPSLDGTTISGGTVAEAFPWDKAFPLEEAFPPIEQVIPLDSIFGVQDDGSGKCRDKAGPWPLCCRGKWNGGGQRNVDDCDLCRLPFSICNCVLDFYAVMKNNLFLPHTK